jgi:CheY-like chemotaxis protein
MLTIFIIEDDTVIRENVCTYLGLSGYSCAVFPDGKDALQAIGERRPDLIVCDIMMPGMDGYAFYHHVRNSYPADSVPFIFLTAKADKA